MNKISIGMATTERQRLVTEATNLMLKRAGVKKEDIYKVALKNWVNKNLDLLTDAEVRKYKGVIL